MDRVEIFAPGANGEDKFLEMSSNSQMEKKCLDFRGSVHNFLGVIPLVVVTVIGFFLIKSMEDYVFVRFNIENNADAKWGVFKIKEESFFNMIPILKEKVGFK